jgi:uncharacterized caspase-like protein
MTRSGWLAAVVLVLLVLVTAHAQTRDITAEGMRSEKRVALIIGNAAYAVGRLNNPVIDARAIAQTLRGLGFEVIAREDLDYQKMRRAVADFGDRIAGGGVGLFYYSGHGIQVNGRNYLVPVDADLKSERYVSAETVDVDSVLAQMQEARTRVNVVILDACATTRSSADSGASRAGSRSWTRQRGPTSPTPPPRAAWRTTASPGRTASTRVSCCGR